MGLIGIGRMGEPMGRLWLKAGHELATYDPHPPAANALTAEGASAKGSAAEVAANSDVTVVVVGYPAQVDACMSNTDGVLAGLQRDGIVVISSTTEPAQVQRLAIDVRKRGGDLIDAPLGRGEPAAHSGDILWFAGGDVATIERARPALAVCGPDVERVGDVGAGQVAKSINNMLLWAAVTSNREAIELARAFNIDEKRLREVLLNSSAASWAMEHWDMMHRTPWAHKDLLLTTQMGDQAGLSLPLAGLLRELVKHNWDAREVELPPPGAATRTLPST